MVAGAQDHGDAEIQDLHRSVERHLDVGRLEVAVDHAAFVRGSKRGCELAADRVA